MRRLAQLRQLHIVAHAQPFLDDGEEVVAWVRTRHPGGRPEGFAYLTERRCVVYWRGAHDGIGAFDWRELRSWGVNRDARGGPLMRVETPKSAFSFQIVTATPAMAQSATAFLERFADLAPDAPRRLSPTGRLGATEDAARHEVSAERLSLAAQTRRIAVTVVGVSLVLAGAALLVLPGPGILVVLAGLAVLASEFDWAKDLLDWAKEKYRNTTKRFKSHSQRPE